MREVPVSNCERQFILQAIKNQRRLDGRANDEYRNLKINFGKDLGSALVAMGETKVLAQVSCELSVPKAVRPNEGMLFINVEIGPMAAPHLEATRNTELHVQINRTLERCFKDSRAVDLESLCVRAEEHVWTLRVDLSVLNHEGNLIDCCSIATLTALAHFRRPDVSVGEGGVKVHTAAEKELLPTVLHHYPVCVSYVTFNDGKIAVLDPHVTEERTAESQMIFGFNAYRELCCLNLGGSSLTSSQMLLQCANRAAQQAKKVVDQVKAALVADTAARESGIKVGFTECLTAQKITGLAEERFALRLRGFKLSEAAGRIAPSMEVIEEQAAETKSKVISLDAQSAILTSPQANIKWMPDVEEDDDDENLVTFASEDTSDNADEDDDDSEDEEKVFVKVMQRLEGKTKQKVVIIDSDSEEEQQMTL